MKLVHLKLLAAVVTPLLISTESLATPTVSGNNLTWSDSGWHQVQRADTFETVCEGHIPEQSGDTGGACQLSAGTYIVINHATGERFDNIVTNDSPMTGEDISVIGGNISWPSDGWYQVQNASTFATVCEGGTSCDVPAGTYLVINHTTGTRYENIDVAADVVTDGATPGDAAPPTSVSVTGNTIYWPDDGWYQVQRASDFSTVCEGGSSCTVSSGEYVVINHSTGARSSDIMVGETTTASPVSSVRLDGNTIIWPDDGWYQVQNAQNYDSMCEGDLSCEVTPGQYIVINHGNGERTLIDVPAADSTSTPSPGFEQTQMRFFIGVPAYVSNALKVRVQWGDVEVNANWVVDETWNTELLDLPSSTVNMLTVTFSDENGALTLGTVEKSIAIYPSESEQITYVVSAHEFDTARWDTDGDGVSNLNELLAGEDPRVASGVSDISDALEIRDDYNLSITVFFAELFVREFPVERPYFSDIDTSVPLPPCEGGGCSYRSRDIHRVTIDIDMNGNGSTHDFRETGSVVFPNNTTKRATRLVADDSITWEGSLRNFSEAGDGWSNTTWFNNVVTLVDDTTRSYSGSTSNWYGADYPQGAFSSEYNIVGISHDEETLCEPVSGSVTLDQEYSFRDTLTTITKSAEDAYWRVSVEDRTDSGSSEEYYVRALLGGFICDLSDL